MSHVTKVGGIYCQEDQLDLLDTAATVRGCELRLGQEQFKAYFSEQKCVHAIRVRGAGRDTYEIGLTRRPTAQGGYELSYDPYNGGFGLEAKIGPGAGLLKKEFAALVAERQLQREGHRVRRVVEEDGSVAVYAMVAG